MSVKNVNLKINLFRGFSHMDGCLMCMGKRMELVMDFVVPAGHFLFKKVTFEELSHTNIPIKQHTTLDRHAWK